MSVCVNSVCAVLCAGTGLRTGWSPVQGVLPTVQKDEEPEKAAKVQQRAVEPQENCKVKRKVASTRYKDLAAMKTQYCGLVGYDTLYSNTVFRRHILPPYSG
jgi:hypothetical protein